MLCNCPIKLTKDEIDWLLTKQLEGVELYFGKSVLTDVRDLSECQKTTI